eukprot:UN01870
MTYQPNQGYNDYNDINKRKEFEYEEYDYLDGEYFVSIDVECAAIGYGHFDSAPCRIAMVDFYGNILFDEITNVPNLVDPLSEFTGLTAWQINRKGQLLRNVLCMFHKKLSYLNKLYKYGVTIIGQSIVMDIIWTSLQNGVHYNRIIDIAQLFKTCGTYNRYQYYSLRQCSWALLSHHMNEKYHDPTEDAQIAMKLYREFCLNGQSLSYAQEKLKLLKSKCSFSNL